MAEIKALDNDDVEIQSQEVIYKGFFALHKLRLRHRLYQGGWSQAYYRELFVRGSAVGVLLYDPTNRLVGMVEQFRVGALHRDGGPWQLEVVAGIVEPGESPEQVARRELHEEAGLSATRLEPICEYLVSPGGSDESLQLYCGLADLRNQGGYFGLDDENEDILFHVLSEEQAFAALDNGQCDNAASIICLQWLKLNHERLRNQTRNTDNRENQIPCATK